MKNDLWIWTDWNFPANQRVAVVDSVWAAIREVGKPTEPDEPVLFAFREAMEIPAPVLGADFIMPTEEWVKGLYDQFIEWVRENREDLLKGKKPKVDDRRPDLAMPAGNGPPAAVRKLLNDKVAVWEH